MRNPFKRRADRVLVITRQGPVAYLSPAAHITPESALDILLAEAWQEGWDAAHETPWNDGPTNPYREEA